MAVQDRKIPEFLEARVNKAPVVRERTRRPEQPRDERFGHVLDIPAAACCGARVRLWGTKRTSGNVRPTSAFVGEADIPPQERDFRF
jgi:hypothetical protein